MDWPFGRFAQCFKTIAKFLDGKFEVFGQETFLSTEANIHDSMEPGRGITCPPDRVPCHYARIAENWLQTSVVATTCSINRIADVPPAHRTQSLRVYRPSGPLLALLALEASSHAAHKEARYQCIEYNGWQRVKQSVGGQLAVVHLAITAEERINMNRSRQ